MYCPPRFVRFIRRNRSRSRIFCALLLLIVTTTIPLFWYNSNRSLYGHAHVGTVEISKSGQSVGRFAYTMIFRRRVVWGSVVPTIEWTFHRYRWIDSEYRPGDVHTDPVISGFCEIAEASASSPDTRLSVSFAGLPLEYQGSVSPELLLKAFLMVCDRGGVGSVTTELYYTSLLARLSQYRTVWLTATVILATSLAAHTLLTIIQYGYFCRRLRLGKCFWCGYTLASHTQLSVPGARAGEIACSECGEKYKSNSCNN